MATTEFGHYLQRLRKQRGLSQRALAERVGSHYTHISNLERGAAEGASDSVLIRLAAALDTDANTLLNRAGRVPKTLKTACEDNPLLTELVRILSSQTLPGETYRRLLEMAREGAEQ